MTNTASAEVIHLRDYRQPDFLITKTYLHFDLQEQHTLVSARLVVQRNSVKDSDPLAPLQLHGQDLELVSLAIDGRPLADDAFVVDGELLVIAGVPDQFELHCKTKIYPASNTSLEGLYQSGKMYCTQCEAQGFRKITYYPDRPDVMSEFTTEIVADKARYPVVLSNGNLIDSGDAENGRHFVKWHDPFKKPAYLFALVAGDLFAIDETFVTCSGREVLLRIFVEEKDKDKCDYAMQSLKRAMRWDEQVYGREYDLDIFMIVAVDDFNMGAMENKGLNIFNTACVLAKSDTTIDADFQRVEGVVAHEYFHNWSGNRVTCRDWFQLSLKEGFTVFRDAQFSADMGSETVKRVEDVSLLRTLQFAEDGGPMAHPVQPASFIEISNFYTLTVYEKGAEVVRMIHTLLGEKQFRLGSDLYFSRHDGQAVTIEDFVAAMADVSGRDFSLFMNWYRQAGTPVLRVKSRYNQDAKTYTLSCTQSCPATPECDDKQPFHIPLALGLLGDAGALPLNLRGQPVDGESEDNTHMVVEITKTQQDFVFENVEEEPVPALLRGFSAPVKLQYRYSRDELMRLMSMESDGFTRWDASQQLAVQVIQEVMAALVNEPAPSVDARLIDAYSLLLDNPDLDLAMVALMLSLPSEAYLAQQCRPVDVDAIHHARNRVRRKIAITLYDKFLQRYHSLQCDQPYRPDADSIARRSLKNAALAYLVLTGKDEAIQLATKQLYDAGNMTDSLAALQAICHSGKAAIETLKQTCLNDFYQKWQHEALVVNHWFAVQASSPAADTLKQVKKLLNHSAFDFKNPNKLRALIGGFCMRNPVRFHDKGGAGYTFLADQIIHLDQLNPQIAARLLTPLTAWKKYDDKRQALMQAQLQRISQRENLSKDVFEIVSKSLRV